MHEIVLQDDVDVERGDLGCVGSRLCQSLDEYDLTTAQVDLQAHCLIFVAALNDIPWLYICYLIHIRISSLSSTAARKLCRLQYVHSACPMSTAGPCLLRRRCQNKSGDPVWNSCDLELPFY